MKVFWPGNILKELKSNLIFLLRKSMLVGSKGQVVLPSIFKIYQNDFSFGDGPESVLDFIREYLPQELLDKHHNLFVNAYLINNYY